LRYVHWKMMLKKYLRANCSNVNVAHDKLGCARHHEERHEDLKTVSSPEADTESKMAIRAQSWTPSLSSIEYQNKYLLAYAPVRTYSIMKNC
jgi:hypothetical protein